MAAATGSTTRGGTAGANLARWTARKILRKHGVVLVKSSGEIASLSVEDQEPEELEV